MPQDNDTTTVEKLLASLRRSYLAEMPDKCDDLEDLVMRLDRAETFEATFKELYRQVHSTKGSAGTHGYSQLSAICHHIEDVLNLVAHSPQKVTPVIVDALLGLVDLLRSTTAAFHAGLVDEGSLEAALAALRARVFPARFRGLYVDASKLSARLCHDALEGLPCTLTVVNDGVQALQRLLQEKFDFVITSKELPQLNGIALTCAVRSAETANSDIRAILLTSKDNVSLPWPGLFDRVLKKDKTISSNLRRVVMELLGIQ
jgi:CheY-like chemotaxis protein/HPt (histidine-containing phosphotransfer) domain-containing protein